MGALHSDPPAAPPIAARSAKTRRVPATPPRAKAKTRRTPRSPPTTLQLTNCNRFRSFKADCNFEDYLLALPFHQRRIISKLRCRSNHLPVASFERHRNPDFVSSCRLCGAAVGDEVHYIFQCPLLFESREVWQSRSRFDARDASCFTSLMQCKDHDELSWLSTFVRVIFQTLENQ